MKAEESASNSQDTFFSLVFQKCGAPESEIRGQNGLNSQSQLGLLL